MANTWGVGGGGGKSQHFTLSAADPTLQPPSPALLPSSGQQGLLGTEEQHFLLPKGQGTPSQGDNPSREHPPFLLQSCSMVAHCSDFFQVCASSSFLVLTASSNKLMLSWKPQEG